MPSPQRSSASTPGSLAEGTLELSPGEVLKRCFALMRTLEQSRHRERALRARLKTALLATRPPATVKAATAYVRVDAPAPFPRNTAPLLEAIAQAEASGCHPLRRDPAEPRETAELVLSAWHLLLRRMPTERDAARAELAKRLRRVLVRARLRTVAEADCLQLAAHVLPVLERYQPMPWSPPSADSAVHRLATVAPAHLEHVLLGQDLAPRESRVRARLLTRYDEASLRAAHGVLRALLEELERET